MSDEQRYDDARRAMLAKAMDMGADYDDPDSENDPAPPRRPWPFWLVAVLALGLALAIGVAAGEVEL